MSTSEDDTRPVPGGDETLPVRSSRSDAAPAARPSADETYASLDRWVDAHFDEEVRFLQELVRVPPCSS